MATTNNLNDFLTDIANAIRTKKNTTEKINAQNFKPEILSIETGITPTGTKEITENNLYEVSSYEYVNVNVSTGGGSIEIPSVENLEIIKGVASWKAPDITSLAAYNPTISYIVSVNGTEIEATKTNINVASYLIAGVNVVSVKVKALLTLNSNETNTTFEYSLPELAVTTLETTLPSATFNMAASKVGTSIYIFGGNTTNSSNHSHTIYKFDTTTETITTLETTLPEGLRGSRALTVGTNVYIFGGFNSDGFKNTIYKFDTTTETIITLETTLPETLMEMGATVVGTNIYLFGGLYKSNNYKNTILKFDTTTETITTLATTLPSTTSNMGVAAIGTNVYLFGGSNGKYHLDYFNTILKFDTTTETITTLATTLPYRVSYMGTALLGTNVYLFGGSNDSSKLSSILEFNSEQNTIIELEATMPVAIYHVKAVATDTSIYIFGGYTSDGSQKTIYKFCEE